jgi:hypothetical protein
MSVFNGRKWACFLYSAAHYGPFQSLNPQGTFYGLFSLRGKMVTNILIVVFIVSLFLPALYDSLVYLLVSSILFTSNSVYNKMHVCFLKILFILSDLFMYVGLGEL